MGRKQRELKSESLNVSAAQKAYIRKHTIQLRWIRFYQIIILFAFLFLWEFTARLGILNSFVFSSPSRVVRTIVTMTVSGRLFYHIGITLLETIESFFW